MIQRRVAKYAADIQNLIEHSTPDRIAAFFAESIQGVGGTVVFPDGYLKAAYEYVRAAGGLCIADEVQTGFGRTGENFWGFQNQGVTPDIVTMAKGIGKGGFFGNVLRIKPPMCITKADVDYIVEVLDIALSEL